LALRCQQELARLEQEILVEDEVAKAAAPLATPPQPGIAMSAVGVQRCAGPPRPQSPTAAVGEGLGAEGASRLNLNSGVDGLEEEEEEVYGSEEEHDEFNSDNNESHLNRYRSPKPTLCKMRVFEKARELQAYFEGLGVSFEVHADDNTIFETLTDFFPSPAQWRRTVHFSAHDATSIAAAHHAFWCGPVATYYHNRFSFSQPVDIESSLPSLTPS
jgi:hypothetical protein